MTSRLLPPDEWPRLTGTLLETVWPNLDRTSSAIAVIEDDGQIVGCVTLFHGWHLEGAWIAPQYRRKVSVGRRLLLAARAMCDYVGATEVFMMARSAQGRALCERLGTATHLTCDHYAVLLGGANGRG